MIRFAVDNGDEKYGFWRYTNFCKSKYELNHQRGFSYEIEVVYVHVLLIISAVEQLMDLEEKTIQTTSVSEKQIK